MSCAEVKALLSEKGVPFIDRDLAKDPAAVEEFKRQGWEYIPVTVIDGRVFHGPVLETIAEALES
ncbi:MAG TPA: glutaredoxin family protein [Chloroflexota bacterium]|jgi:glutaredoxin|nr:glutaredoxin family protein [Chloroflexota bacterium]